MDETAILRLGVAASVMNAPATVDRFSPKLSEHIGPVSIDFLAGWSLSVLGEHASSRLDDANDSEKAYNPSCFRISSPASV
jgi:hypothetical protein